jgi:hypothetical protein
MRVDNAICSYNNLRHSVAATGILATKLQAGLIRLHRWERGYQSLEYAKWLNT